MNQILYKSRINKNDEYYTQLPDIEQELSQYTHHFKDKIVYCNCDNPDTSNFVNYFQTRFYELKLKKLIATSYNICGAPSVKLEVMPSDTNPTGPLICTRTSLRGNGDFRSDECIDLLDDVDIVVTNPPFSLFREFIALLIKHKKRFLILGNKNAITYKEILPLIVENKIWLGTRNFNSDMWFEVPENAECERITNGKRVRHIGVCWFTNLDRPKVYKDLIQTKYFNPEEYPSYDGYDAIEVSQTKSIPIDYFGVMGVPISALGKLNLEQFEIIGIANHGKDNRYDLIEPSINGKKVFKRLLIRRKC